MSIGPSRPELPGGLDQADLRLEVETVARLRLDRRHAVTQHLVEPAAAVRQQLLGRGGPRGGHGRQDPAARLEDLEIARALLAHLPLVRPRAAEQQVRVRVDEARRHAPTARIDPGEPAQRVALGLQRPLDGGPRADRDDPAFPAGDGRAVRRVRAARVAGRQPADVGLGVAHPDPAGERHHLGRADDHQARCRLVAATTVDETERTPAHRTRSLARAASRRSSSACIGE